MNTALIVDAHLHTYKTPEIGLQAMQGSGKSGCSGILDEILPILDKNGIAKAVMVNVTPVTDMIEAAVAKLPSNLSGAGLAQQIDRIREEMIARMIRRNEWTCAVAREYPVLVPFFSVDPAMSGEAMLREIDERVEDGGKGLKLHPPLCRFFPNRCALWPAYRHCEEIGLPVVFHAGVFSGEVQYSEPKHFADVLSSFPALPVVLAHMGVGFPEQALALAKRFPNLYFDTSVAICATPNYGNWPAGKEAAMIREIGVQRVMFGSDWPWYDPGRDLEFIRGLALSDAEKDLILRDNALRIYKI